MKYFFIYLSVLLVGLFNFAHAETWTCSYEYKGEAHQRILIREEGFFNSPPANLEYLILNEDENYAHLYLNIGGVYWSLYLNKKRERFMSTFLSPYMASEHHSGKCTKSE